MREKHWSGYLLPTFLLLSSLGLVYQIPPVMAQTSVTIDPSTVDTSPGAQFTVSAMVSNVQNFQAYDITVTYESAHIQLLSGAAERLAGSVFDGHNTFLVDNSAPVVGSVRVAITLLEPPISVASSAALVFLRFKTLLAGSSPIDIPGVIIAVMVNGEAVAAPVTVSPGRVNAPAGRSGIFFKSFGLKSSDQVLKLSLGQRTTFITARLSNNGTTDGFAQFIVRLVSRTGIVLSIRSPCVKVPAQVMPDGSISDRIAAEVAARFKADPQPDSFAGVGVLTTSATATLNPDGSCKALIKGTATEVRAMVEPFIVIN